MCECGCGCGCGCGCVGVLAGIGWVKVVVIQNRQKHGN